MMSEMDQETAKKLLVEGGTFVFLGVPPETQFGIDMQCWNTEDDFRGIKMIPPGLHYIHYAAVSQGTGDAGARSGFMHFFTQQEFVVKMWDKTTDDISVEEISDESIQRLKDNLLNLDRHLAPYPYDGWHKWKLLTSHITGEIAKELSPPNGIIRSSVDLLPTSDADRPRGKKPTDRQTTTTEDQASADVSLSSDTEGASPGRSDVKKARRLTRAEREDAMLPQLKVAPEAALRLTRIPVERYPPGATPAEITKHCLDQSYTLESIISRHRDPLHIIGELQFTFLCFLIGGSLEALEHWRELVVLTCACEDAVRARTDLYCHVLRVLHVQLHEMPADHLADIVADNNAVYRALRALFRTIHSCAHPRLRTARDTLRDSLTERLQWDFGDLDVDDEDERPVVVGLTQDDHVTT